jgi:hypothetical protein
MNYTSDRSGGRSTVREESTSLLSRTRGLASLLLVILVITAIFVIGRVPVHRTNITHTDPEGDVSNPDCDIVRIKSFLDRKNIVIEMMVAGRINNNTTASQYSYPYEYRVTIVAKMVDDDEAHIYVIRYKNGSLGPASDARAVTENDTLTIFFPLSEFVSGSYMIGLEGWASDYNWVDRTPSDRNATVARLLF